MTADVPATCEGVGSIDGAVPWLMDRHCRGVPPARRGVGQPVSARKPGEHLLEFRVDVHLVEALRQGPTGGDRRTRFRRAALVEALRQGPTGGDRRTRFRRAAGRRSAFLRCAFVRGTRRTPSWFPGGRACGVGLYERSSRRPIRGGGGGRDRAEPGCAS